MATKKIKSSQDSPAISAGFSVADDADGMRLSVSHVNYVVTMPKGIAVSADYKNTVYFEKPEINPSFRLNKSLRNTVYAVPPVPTLAAVVRNTVYISPPFALNAIVKNYIYSTDSSSRTMVTVNQFLNQYLFDTSYQFEFSNSSVNQFNSMVIFASVEPLPFSDESVNSFYQLVTIGADYDTTSMKFVGQFVNTAIHQSPYTRLDETWSQTKVGLNTMLVCQSIDIPYVPRSGIDTPQVYNLSVSSLPVEWETRPADVVTVRSLVTQARPPERLPQSTTVVGEMVSLCSYPSVPDARVGVVNANQLISLASIPVDPDPTVGMVIAAQTVDLSAVSSPEDLPISPESVKQAIGLAAFEADDTLPQSAEDVPFVVSTAVVGSDVEWLWSPVQVNTQTLVAAWDSPQPPLESFFVLNAVGSLSLTWSMESDFGPAHKDSYTEMGALPILTLLTAPARFYPPLENVEDLAKGNHVEQYFTATSIRTPDPMPQSNEDVGTIRIATAARTPMPTPEEVATQGIFTGGVVGHVAKESLFPSTDIPQSFVDVVTLAENIAVVATYQDIRLPLTIGHIDSVAYNIASSVDYPPANAAKGHGVVSSMAQNIASKANYLPANTLNSLSLTTLTSANVAFSTEFPDKDVVFSRIESRQVAASLAMGAEYPDKNKAYSSVTTSSVYQNVMRVDSSLYQLPRAPQRHRVRIVCKMIYGYKNR